MLTDEQYKELFRFRDGDIPLEDIDPNISKFLVEQGYISKFQFVLPSGEISKTVMCSITSDGETTLEKFYENSEKNRNEQTRKDAEHRAKTIKATIDRRKKFIRDLAVAIIAGIFLIAIQKFLGIIQ